MVQHATSKSHPSQLGTFVSEELSIRTALEHERRTINRQSLFKRLWKLHQTVEAEARVRRQGEDHVSGAS